MAPDSPELCAQGYQGHLFLTTGRFGGISNLGDWWRVRSYPSSISAGNKCFPNTATHLQINRSLWPGICKRLIEGTLHIFRDSPSRDMIALGAIHHFHLPSACTHLMIKCHLSITGIRPLNGKEPLCHQIES